MEDNDNDSPLRGIKVSHFPTAVAFKVAKKGAKIELGRNVQPTAPEGIAWGSTWTKTMGYNEVVRESAAIHGIKPILYRKCGRYQKALPCWREKDRQDVKNQHSWNAAYEDMAKYRESDDWMVVCGHYRNYASREEKTCWYGPFAGAGLLQPAALVLVSDRR